MLIIQESREYIATTAVTSVHDALGMHMFEGRAELDEILPDCALRDKPLLPFEVSDHAAQVTSVSKLEHNGQLVVLDERSQVRDNVWVVQFLKI